MQRSMMRNVFTVSILLLTAAAWAGADSTRERRSPNPAMEAPFGNQTPSGTHPVPGEPAMTPIRAADVAQAIRHYIAEEARVRDGWCRISDPVESATLDLKLQAVSAQKLMRVRPDTFVTCASFASADGTSYDVDFYVRGTTRYNLEVIDATIHSRDGLQRYAWADEKGMARVKVISSEMPMREELAH